MGVCLVIELSRRRLHDFGLSGKWIYLWLIISCSIYGYYMYDLYAVDGLSIAFFEEILLIELGVIFIPTMFYTYSQVIMVIIDMGIVQFN